MLLYLSALLLILSWLSAEHFPPWISWHAEAMVFVATILLSARGLWLARRSAGGEATLGFPALGLGLLGLLVLICVQALSGQIQFAGDALVLGLYASLCLAAVTLGFASAWGAGGGGAGLASQPEPLRLMAVTLLVGALFSSIIAWVQVLDVWETSAWIVRMPSLRRPGGNLGQPNHLATLLLMGLASLIYLWEKGTLGHWSAGLMSGVMASGVVLTESRTGLLSVVVMLVWWFAGKWRVGFRLQPKVVFPAAAVLFLAFWLWPRIMWVVEVSAPGAQVDTSGGLRLVIWPQLWQAVLMHPWFGWGLREVSAAHNAVADAYPNSELFTYSHNIVLDMALGMGLPLTLLVVLGVGRWLWQRLPAVRSLNAWYCVAAAVPLTVHSMLELPFAYAYFLAPVMFLLGRLEAEVGGYAAWPIKRRWASAALLIVSTLGAGTVLEYFKIEEDYRVIRFKSLNMGSTPADYARPELHLLTQMDALLIGARMEPVPNMDSADLDLLRKVALRHPGPATLNRYALALALNGNPEEAIRQMRVIRVVLGEKTYRASKAKWQELALNTYPQLNQLQLP